jgi:2-dehydropantoate 2-reductase
MGGVWASRLRAAGHEVAILDVAQEALAAIERDGLDVQGPGEEHRITRLLATNDATLAGEQDAAIFFVKAHHTRAAAELARAAIGPATTVVTLQNGWGNADTLAEYFAPEQLVMGVTYHSARVLAPGHIAHTAAAGPTFLGPYREGDSLDRAQAVADAMNEAGIATTVTAGVVTEIWKKLVHNSASLPVTALTRLTAGELGADEAALRVCDGLQPNPSRFAAPVGWISMSRSGFRPSEPRWREGGMARRRCCRTSRRGARRRSRSSTARS